MKPPTPRTDTKAERILSELGPNNNGRFAAMCDFARELECENARLTAHIPAAGAWRDPMFEVPEKTGRILVWIRGGGPAVVNVEETCMHYWDGDDESNPASPEEWVAWAQVNLPVS